MSTSPIENFLQVSTAPRQTTAINQPESLEAELFQQHLQEATSASKAKENALSDEAVEDSEESTISNFDDDQSTSTKESSESEETGEVSDEQETDQDKQQEDDQDAVSLSEEAVQATDISPQIEESEIVISTEFESTVEVATSDESGQEEQTPTESTTQVDTESLTESSEFHSPQVTTTEAQTESEVESTLLGTDENTDQDLSNVVTTAEGNSNSLDEGTFTTTTSEPIKDITVDAKQDLKDPSKEEKPEQVETKSLKPATKQEVFQSNAQSQETLSQANLAPSEEVAIPQTPSTETGQPVQATNDTASTQLAAPSTSAANETNSTATPTAETQTDPTVPVDRARFIQRVSGAFKAAQQRDGEIQLRLSPPELGSLKIEISMKQGVLTAQLETDTSVARNLLLDNLPALRERLAEQEISIEKFDVDVRDESSSQDNQAQAKDKETNNSQSGRSVNRRQQSKNDNDASESAPPANASEPVSDNGLDVMI